MTKRFFAILRYTTVVAIMASAFVLSGCGDDDDGPTIFDGNIVEFIKSDQFKQSVNNNADISFDSLVMYLDKFPDLEALLTASGTTEYTLFAPSNKAFAGLTALPGLKDPDLVNPDIIMGVLAYHIVAGKKMQSDLAAGSTISTIFVNPLGGSTTPEVIKVNNDGTLLTGSQNSSIQVTQYDQLASNGVVHTTATVLIPPSTGGQLASILGTLGATVLLGKDFTYMAYLIAIADATASGNDTFTAIIAGEDGLTLLAIPNDVFKLGAAAALSKADPSDLEIKAFIAEAFGTNARTILENHVVLGQYTVAESTTEGVTQFENGAVLNTWSDKQLLVTTGLTQAQCQCPTGVVIAGENSVGGGTSNAPIFKADIDTESGISNGVLQVVGGVILP